MKTNPLLRAVLTPVLFEMCGIIPIVLVSLGILNIGAGVTLRNILVYQYSPVFFVIAAGFFGYSVYSYLKQHNSCNLEGLKTHRQSIIKSIIALIAVEGLLLAALQFTEGEVYGAPQTLFAHFITIGPVLGIFLILFIVLTKKNNRLIDKTPFRKGDSKQGVDRQD